MKMYQICNFLMIIIGVASATNSLVRSDGKCGYSNLLPDGNPGQCDPFGPGYCCSKWGNCGNTADHCDCVGCIDYKALLPDAEFKLVRMWQQCNNKKIELGTWGKDDPQAKLQRCANEVRADSRCGISFFFRENKGRCFCEEEGETCNRVSSPNKDEYILKNEFVREDGHFCPFCNNTYNSLEEAKTDCRADPDCDVIYDLFCDGFGYYCTCPITSIIQQTHPNGLDCIYKRT